MTSIFYPLLAFAAGLAISFARFSNFWFGILAGIPIGFIVAILAILFFAAVTDDNPRWFDDTDENGNYKGS